jgi:transcriptional regulator with XRE-family HTH domain
MSELRASVAASLDRLNRDHGGRHLGRVAAALGVHRSSVSRWMAGEASPSFERCMELANRYPGYFDRAELVDLLTRSALGDAQPVPSLGGGVREVGPANSAVSQALVSALEREPAAAADREFLHVSLEAEAETRPPPGGSIYETEEDRVERIRFGEAVRRRAAEGWRVRTVANANGPQRLESIEAVVAALDGPDVEIRTYAMTVPLVMSMFLIGRRDAFIGCNTGRLGRPTPNILHLASPDAVAWATRYFDTLFNEAPFRLRTPKGASDSELARFRSTIEEQR